MLAHERSHISRKDHLWKPLGFCLLILHWFNPLIWIGYVLLCRDIELACDEKVIREFDNEEKADYSQTLLACSVNRRMISACPVAFGETSVKERVTSVLNYKKPAFWIIIAAIVVCVAVAVCFLTSPLSRAEGDGGIDTGDSGEESTLPASEEDPDDFADNYVIVVMTHEETMKLKSYSPEDFGEISCINVYDCMPGFTEKLKNGSLNDEDYKLILCLELSERSKDGVLAAIELLNGMDGVFQAQPDFLISAIDYFRSVYVHPLA